MAAQDYESGITGRSKVRFGGKIHMYTSYSAKHNCGCISFSELKDSYKVGEEIAENASEYPKQVSLMFDNLVSIDMLRDALDNLESAFKNGEFLKDQKYKRRKVK